MSIKYKKLGDPSITQIFTLIKNKFSSLASVATTGSYNDLSDKPNSPTLTFQVGSVQLSSDNVSSINIPIEITSVDGLFVYHNGLLLVPDINYTATTTTITLNNYTASLGDIFTFISTSLKV